MRRRERLFLSERGLPERAFERVAGGRCARRARRRDRSHLGERREPHHLRAGLEAGETVEQRAGARAALACAAPIAPTAQIASHVGGSFGDERSRSSVASAGR